ncbi:unnamed protein product [Clonostachys rhizophaga]|uniref:thioredoxin-dependent peroxiredoxin n=1 Tax=Clonostachys rhizophaga TaxID=160324 RepID=A0A9N9V9C2_9HYPO|nr:unnamed protein product [Clonostachys rhizophaga]
MPVELRKRKAHQQPAPAPAPKKKAAAATKTKKAAGAAKPAKKAKAAQEEPEKPSKAEPEPEPESKDEAAEETAKPEEKKKANGEKLSVGDEISLDDFGGKIQTNDGKETTLKELVDESKAGVVLFTYPKASTPGCTTQVCLFRDSYEPLTADGLAIYGLSNDSPKANTTFKEKQKLPYPLLCDPSQTLIGAIGLKKTPKGTQRGVFVVNKDGKVLVAEAGGPAATVERVKKLVEELKA